MPGFHRAGQQTGASGRVRSADTPDSQGDVPMKARLFILAGAIASVLAAMGGTVYGR